VDWFVGWIVDWWVGGLDWWIGGLVDWIGGLVGWWIGGLVCGFIFYDFRINPPNVLAQPKGLIN